MLLKRLGKTPIQVISDSENIFTVADFKKAVPFSKAKDIIAIDNHLMQLFNPLPNQKPMRVNMKMELNIDMNLTEEFNKTQIARILLEESFRRKNLLQDYPFTRNTLNYLINEFGWEAGSALIAETMKTLQYAPISHASKHLHIFSVIADLIHSGIEAETVLSEISLICLGVESLDTLALIRSNKLDPQLAIALAQQV